MKESLLDMWILFKKKKWNQIKVPKYEYQYGIGVNGDVDAAMFLQSMLLFLFLVFNIIELIKLLEINNGLSGA